MCVKKENDVIYIYNMFYVSFYLNFEHLTRHVNIRIEFHVSVHGADAESCCLRGETRRFNKSNEICCHPSR